MASIGTFKKSGHEFQGEIVTLSVQTKGVRIVPDTNRTSENAPSHRVYVGRAEIGAAWSKRSSEGRDYLSVKLDDPSFTVPMYANLVRPDPPGGAFRDPLRLPDRAAGSYVRCRQSFHQSVMDEYARHSPVRARSTWPFFAPTSL